MHAELCFSQGEMVRMLVQMACCCDLGCKQQSQAKARQKPSSSFRREGKPLTIENQSTALATFPAVSQADMHTCCWTICILLG